MSAVLPDRHALIPIDAAFAGQPLCICVAAHTAPAAPDEASPAGPLVLLRSTIDGRVYLGAVCDAAGQIREWVEIWVQTTVHLADAFHADRGDLANAALDARWRAMAASFIADDPAACIQTGHEQTHPRPAFLNLDTAGPWHPADPEGRPWMLATDDAELLAAGLPAYSSSRIRLWRADGADGTPRFAAPESGAVAAGAAKIESLPLPAGARLAPFNPEGGLLFIRRLAPFSLDDYAAFLGGRPWKGSPSGRDTYLLDTAMKPLGDWDYLQQGGAHLFSAAEGRAGRFLETFHLKLSLFRQAVQLTRDAIHRRQLPLLNLSADSFRVALAAPAGTLPALWTAHLVSARAGQAVALPIKTVDTRYFMAIEQPSASVYRPSFMGQPIRGQGTVRVRRVFADTGERTCIDATLVTHERVGHSASDILWLRLPLTGRVVDLFGRLDTGEGLASGEARFRTIPQDLDPAVDEALRATEGAVFPDTPFETIPLLSSPADLYSLGILGALLLTVNSGNTLGVAADDMIGFARKLVQENRPGEDLAARALRVAGADPRVRAALGAHRLAYDGITQDDAFGWLPPEFWWQVLATLARFFPGVGPDSFCKDFGDASPFNLEKIFDPPLLELDNLLIRSRSLIVTDWTANREVSRVIRRLA
ncbi:hypothetical protein OH491_02030 [Termitidicoccus mucosus]|uniref:Uncharacterized protein n=1 Tax=Termitidicoccus mucosus TaxID=1184151 RepID=A0A178IL51_9BACT|nr:hypothetical protein AW736_07530 [Opitutaceae bacterium TSB47]